MLYANLVEKISKTNFENALYHTQSQKGGGGQQKKTITPPQGLKSNQ